MTSLEPHLSPMLTHLSEWVGKHDNDISDTFNRIGRAIEFMGTGAGRAYSNIERLIELVQLPGKLWDEQFKRDAAGIGRPDGNGYQIGDPDRLSGLDQGIAAAGPYSRGEPGFEPATTSERIGLGRGPGVPLGPGAAPISSPEQQRRARQGRDILVGLGWSSAQAAGIMANLDRESRLNEGAVGDSGQAYGVAQWHPDRRANIAAGMGRSPIGMSFEDQIKAVDWELRNTERGAGDALRGATTAREAGEIVSRRYERPGDTEGEAALRGRSADFFDRRNPVRDMPITPPQPSAPPMAAKAMAPGPVWPARPGDTGPANDAELSAMKSKRMNSFQHDSDATDSALAVAQGSKETRDYLRNGGSGSAGTVQIDINHTGVPETVNMRAQSGGSAEIGGIRVQRAMRERRDDG